MHGVFEQIAEQCVEALTPLNAFNEPDGFAHALGREVNREQPFFRGLLMRHVAVAQNGGHRGLRLRWRENVSAVIGERLNRNRQNRVRGFCAALNGIEQPHLAKFSALHRTAAGFGVPVGSCVRPARLLPDR